MGIPGKNRCHAWRELVPGANSGYATRQSARFLKHKQTLGFMDRICFSSNIGFFTPPPALLCLHTQFKLFNIFKLLFIFYYFEGLDYKQGFSEKNVFRLFSLLKFIVLY